MSHHKHKEEIIICPNCGFHATKNFCAQCGQETHLHKETFLGMIFHFVAHYFHYDSKFWQTMKTLFASPGKLTVAYVDKQRNRYLPPVSMYIFISIVFFLTGSLGGTSVPDVSSKAGDPISLDSQLNAAIPDTAKHAYFQFADKLTRSGQLLSGSSKESKEFGEKFTKAAPKIFFFMIPLMAFMLQLLFFRRKEILFVHHAVFALHYHALWFACMTMVNLIGLLPINIDVTTWVLIPLMIFTIVYFALALIRVYGVRWLKAAFLTLFVGITYVICMFIVVIFITVSLLP